MRKLRTIICLDGIPRWNSLTCPWNLRILDMANAGLKKVPSVIGQLVHLRYLDLSANDIKDLPKSICRLYQLQTLRLLRCHKLEELPKELHRLNNIRHIKTYNTMLASRGLGLLRSLQTLPCLKLRDREGWTIGELGPLNQAKGDLYIEGLEHVKNKEEAKEAGIKTKGNILKLELVWGSNSDGNDDEDVLGGLESHPNIESLGIRGFKGVRFPWWITTMSVKQRGHPAQLSYLKEVELTDCARCEKVPSLGQLPHLSMLWLVGLDEVECIGEEFYMMRRNNMIDVGTNVPLVGVAERKPLFPALREFYIEKLQKLATWMPPSSAQAIIAFPKLETLDIQDCERLQMVPALHYESLKHLKLENVGGIQPLDIIKGIHGLTLLCVWGMKEMVSLPEELSSYRKLQELDLANCEKVKSIPSEMISLKNLGIRGCPSLCGIEEGMLQGLSCLSRLSIKECAGLKRMPKSLEDCTSLKVLEIRDCPLIEDPIPNISRLQGLTSLTLNNAGRLTRALRQWIPQLHCLTHLGVGGWGEEWDMSLLISTLPSLRSLYLRDCPNLKPLPSGQQHLFPPFLHRLEVTNVWEMEEFPEWIGSLSSLQSLSLANCNKLEYLASKQAMSHCSQLRTLFISDCPLLKQRQ